MATTATTGTNFDSELAQYMARQKRLADQYAGNPDAELEDFKKLMGKFAGNGVAPGGPAATPSPVGTDSFKGPAPTPSSIGLEPAVPSSPTPVSPASPEDPPKAAEEPPPAPPPPPKPKKKKKKNCLQKTFDVIGKIVKVVVPAVVGFFTGGPVGAVMGGLSGVSSVIEDEQKKKQAAAA